MAGSYNGTGFLVEVWSACVGAVLTNATAGRRLSATQNIGNVQLDIVTYERVRSLAAAQASVHAFQTDLKRCGTHYWQHRFSSSILLILHLAAASLLMQS